MPDLATITRLDEGSVWRVTFGGQDSGNVLDGTTMAALRDVFTRAGAEAPLRAILLEGAGRHFSFGASVQEHLPAQVASMLSAIRGLAESLLDTHVVTVACVRGQCLGGGLELASLCHRVVAHVEARLGQPEIALGVFAPIASVVLPERLHRGAAEDICLTGRPLSAADAHAMGLVDEVTSIDPTESALTWVRTHLRSRSASSLRHAVKAVRYRLRERLRTDLPILEDWYLRELMPTADAQEGLRAFLDKRPPTWRHR